MLEPSLLHTLDVLIQLAVPFYLICAEYMKLSYRSLEVVKCLKGLIKNDVVFQHLIRTVNESLAGTLCF